MTMKKETKANTQREEGNTEMQNRNVFAKYFICSLLLYPVHAAFNTTQRL